MILVDCDLRHPEVGVRLGMKRSAGVSEVITGQAELGAALVDVVVGEGGGGRLRVLPAGTRPPNPARLLGSERMAAILDELAAKSEIVIVDTPPILNVSDALPLLDRVSGIVVVAQVGATGRDALLRMRQVLETAHGSILGAVATGSRDAGLYGYGTDYYAAEPERPSPSPRSWSLPGRPPAGDDQGREVQGPGGTREERGSRGRRDARGG